MSADDKVLLDRCRRCIGALVVALEAYGGAATKQDLLDGARQLLAEVGPPGEVPAQIRETVDREGQGGNHG